MPRNGLNIKTSCYAMSKTIRARNPDAVFVSISVSRPGWFVGEKYPILAPARQAVELIQSGRVDHAEFTNLYSHTLNALDCDSVLDDLSKFGDEIILMCYCSRDVANGKNDGQLCHRRIAAEWLENTAGVTIPEYGFERSETQNLIEFE